MRHGATRYVIFVVPVELFFLAEYAAYLPSHSTRAERAERALGRATRHPARALACVKRGPQCGTAGTFLPAIRRRSS